jgi:hypothetical protein
MKKYILPMVFGIVFAVFAPPTVADPPKYTCQWEMGSVMEKDLGCVGRIGLMRIRKSSENPTPGALRKASQVLFGSPELPVAGSEVVIQRSAHLREWYEKERDDQVLTKAQKICIGNNCSRMPPESCTVMPDRTKRIKACLHPTYVTEYFSAGTTVKILDYQQMGHLFALVQIVKVESNDPVEDEKKYEFDREEVI